MKRMVGTVSRGLRAPIVREGDNIIDIVVDVVLESSRVELFKLKDKDIVGITESLVARAQGNYISLDDITREVNEKIESDNLAVVYPILSRNRFAPILRAIANTNKKINLFLEYPSDEVGNHLMDIDEMYKLDLDPYKEFLTEKKYRELFGEEVKHPFTGVDYIKMYNKISENINIYLTNNLEDVLKYSKDIIVANIHDRKRTKEILKKLGADMVLGLEDLANTPSEEKGYNEEYGLLGSNMATDTKIKLFPRDCDNTVREIQKKLKEKTGKTLEVMVYGDGAFKDPVGKIWELADPVVSPGYTNGLQGTPDEIKIKYIADNELEYMDSTKTMKELKNKIKKHNLKENESDSLGTTPRQITDLVGSLCDLTSGSGDKGTPIVLVQGYFDNMAEE